MVSSIVALQIVQYFNRENLMNNLQIPLEDIKLATQNFSQENCVRSGRDWKAYKGKLPHANANTNANADVNANANANDDANASADSDANANANGHTTIVAKRWNSKSVQGDHQFRKELDILFKRKHDNIIGLVGYCNKMNETIIVYKDVPNGSLDKHLNDASLRWMKRLEICIAIASGLEFLHGGDATLKKVVHGDIKSNSILLNVDWKAASKVKIKNDWKAKISNLELFSVDSLHLDMEHVSHDAYGYLDPEYAESGLLTAKSDIYSLGVILFEILCGRLAWGEGCVDHSQSLGPLAKRCYEEGKLNEMVFEGIQKQIVPRSFTAYADIACRCLHDDSNRRPEATTVVKQLREALECQEDDEIWESKLPRNYRDIIEMSGTPEIYSTIRKRELYKLLSEGILIQKEKVWLSLSSTGKVNTLISATVFSYGDHRSHKCRSIQKSITRFHRVAKMTDISNLKIRIKFNTKILSSDVAYKVHLVFKLCDPIKVSRKLMYVNLKYKMGAETLHAYFATQRDDDSGWMMIELCRFLNQKEDNDFEVSLESFSRCYCESRSIYVQGIEFKAIDNMNQEEYKKLKGVQLVLKSNLNIDQGQRLSTDFSGNFKRSEDNYHGEKLISLSEENGKKYLMLSAKEFLYNPPGMKPFHFESSAESRFQDVKELQREQVFRIKYNVEIEKLSPFTEYACYLVFKLSKKCRGLYCPVKVRDLLNRKKTETKIIYFRSPAPLNQHDADCVLKQRKDGWMEVMVWKFNSKNQSGKNYIPMNLKLITYEGTMSGLIICGLEIRPK